MKKYLQVNKFVFAVLFLTFSSFNHQSFSQSFCYSCNGYGTNCDEPNIAPNPPLTATCGQLEIALVLDQSGSVQGYEDEVKEATLSFFNKLLCTGAKISIIAFNDYQSYIEETPRLVDDNYIADVENFFDPGIGYNGYSYQPFYATNWQGAMTFVDYLTPSVDLVLFFTDGNPTVYLDSAGYYQNCGNANTTQTPEIINPMKLSNQVKAKGTHMFVIGVGNTAGFENNIAKISGTTAFVDGSNGNSGSVATSDYAITNDFGALANNFKAFADQICPPPIDCSSFEVSTSNGLSFDLRNEIIDDGSVINITWENSDDSSYNGSTNIIADASSQGVQQVDITTNPNGTTWGEGSYTVSVNISTEYDSSCFKEAFCFFELSIASPVTLSMFNAQAYTDEVFLEWETVSENNNDYFEIEYMSSDQNEFITLAQIKGNGTTTETHQYSYKTGHLPSNVYYFRLKQVDLNGDFEYSDLQKVVVSNEEDVKVYPNPTKEFVTIDLPKNETYNVTVSNTNGEMMCIEPTYESGQRLSLDGFAKGLYIIHLSKENFERTIKVVVD